MFNVISKTIHKQLYNYMLSRLIEYYVIKLNGIGH